MYESPELIKQRCEDTKERFRFYGVSIADWAKRNGFSQQAVYDVLNGKCKCERGEAHRIAVALRIKRGSAAEMPL